MSTAEDGFFSIDALVGVLVLSLTLALTLTAASVGRRLSDRALEVRRATALSAYLLEQARSGGPRLTEGRTALFTWRLNVSPVPSEKGAPEAIRLCRAVADVRARSGRSYRFSWVRTCGATLDG
jgi:hypothetical protein